MEYGADNGEAKRIKVNNGRHKFNAFKMVFQNPFSYAYAHTYKCIYIDIYLVYKCCPTCLTADKI